MSVSWQVVALALTVAFHAGLLVARWMGSRSSVGDLEEKTEDLPEIRQRLEEHDRRLDRHERRIEEMDGRLYDYMPAIVEQLLDEGRLIQFERGGPDDDES